MRYLLILILFLAFSAGAATKEQKLNTAKLELAYERLRVIKADEDLKRFHQSLMNKHLILAENLAKHPQIKDSKLKEPHLTRLKIKILREDEELRELRQAILKMHRKLEDKLAAKKSIRELVKKVQVLEE